MKAAGKQEWHKDKEEDEWTKLIIEGVKREKQKCQSNKTLVFSNPTKKRFELTVPGQG